ncbi:leucine-rich repeat extensin-like protein 4 [Amaranthus tricolor]|uniref:leucine-rich repeat extensin-like protein 4 n=1 Tax=Amaranthus tricolor TaxID=29722 RepID=UPI00258EDE28|nr:leucine-rich repeat extensin-like protein 4 [Amaranthus tricolor]
MTTFSFLSSLLTLLFLSAESPFGLGIGIGIGVGGGAGVWSAGGANTQNLPPQQSPSLTPSLDRAYTALQAWKSVISEDPNGVLASWVGPNVCNYKGVFCSSLQDDYIGDCPSYSSVSSIDLNHANLKGVLVNELSLITELSLLHLNSNRFSGTIPETFKEFEYLTELDLSNNQFSGTFPNIVLYMPNLMYLDIRFNNFYGLIPDELFNTQLDAIFINNNQFTGQIPQNMGISPASVINLSNNNFSGGIPISLGYVNTALKEILFLNNQLSGCIPDGFGLFSEITVLDVSYNSLMGHLPDSLSCLEGIEVLNLAHNKLSGELPDLVCSLRNLLNLSVEYNFFSGFSPRCTNLIFRSVGFDFSLNCIPGRGMQRPPPQCYGVPSMIDNCFRIPSAKPFLCGSSLLDLILGIGNVPFSP